jgi:NADH-quinone oxidoreductase subunit C
MPSDSLNSHPTAAALADLANGGKFEFGELTIEVAPENILAALGRLKRDLKFERLSTVTGVDRYPAEPRFEVVYHLQSVARKERVRLKARVPGENPAIESAVSVYRSADWYERETFDLFGVRFLNHPNLTRIMLPEDWEGYPLRKDYPVTGTRY